jgi:hypothetical protein
MRVLLLLSLLVMPTAASAFDPETLQWESLQALRGQLGTCQDRRLNPTGHHVPDAHRELVHLLGGMLEMEDAICPGIAAAAAANLRRRIGAPEQPDVDTELLALAWQAAERGQGMAADPVLADRYGRILWLFSDHPPVLPRWPEAAQQAWLRQPETIRLLRAQTGSESSATRRARQLLGEILLDRDLPGFDPVRAVALLETARPLRASQVLTDGVYLPPDYPRAARLLLGFTHVYGVQEELRTELVRIGRLAAAAAHTPLERARALHILFAAGVEDPALVTDDRAALLRAIGPVPTTRLAGGDADRIGRALDSHFARNMPYRAGDSPRPRFPAAAARGLIGPDGRMALVEIARPSPSERYDLALRFVWAHRAERVDLGATARGRFVWVDLPPVDPGMTETEARERWGEPDLD